MATGIVVSQPVQLERNETFAPRTIQEAILFAEMILESGMAPKAYQGKKPASIVVALQFGLELGLQPMQSLQNIANINGNPSIWGDAALALCLSKSVCEYVVEQDLEDIKKAGKAVCRAKRRGSPEEVKRTFSLDDAKTAGLLGKDTPWKTYPNRMLQLRARGFALRDAFPDILKGLALAEEVMDYSTIEGDPQPNKTPTPISSDPVQRDPEDEVLGKEWATSFYRTYSKSGWLPEESKIALEEVCGITDSRMVTKKHGDQMMKWASTPKPKPEPTPPENGRYDFGDFGQDEPGSNG